MFKQAIIAGAVLAASTGLALANGGTYEPAPTCVHSAYVGVAVSRDFFNINNGHNHNYSNNRFHFWGDSTDYGNDGWNGEINAGIGWVLQQHYYLGGEIFGSVTNTKINVNGVAFNNHGFTNFSYQIKNKYMYGIDFVPGVKISDSTMLYGKVGYVNGGFSTDNNNLYGNYYNNNNHSKNRSGLQLGLGLETMVTNNVSAKLEYDYNYFSKFNNSNFRPTVDVVKLGVAYHFMEA